jgi:hypothetical protein
MALIGFRNDEAQAFVIGGTLSPAVRLVMRP